VKAPPQPDPEALRQAQIALEREKARQEEEERKQAELERQREERRKAAEAKKKHEAELAKKKREEELAKKKREEELARKKAEEQRIAEAKRKEAEEKKRRQEEREAKLREQIRKDTMSRIQNMAGTGAPDAAGTAARSAGPSKSWAGRVIARVRPNIVYTEVVTGNPEAVVEVRMAPDGTIVGKRLKKSSGNRSWDDAVLRALDKTEVLPRDPETGRVPNSAELVFRPKD
jgi:colicin import membrane protein